MVTAVGLLAAGCCGLFVGAAVYVTLVEHPARVSCGIEAAIREWAAGYKRAAVMQASLALLSGVAGVLAWVLGGPPGYLVGALLLLAIVPFTVMVIFPTNKRLHELYAHELHARGEIGDAPALLRRWNALHAIRSVLSLVAFVLMLVALQTRP